LTFNNVILDISRAFAAGQAYVALSRCTSLQGIVLQSFVSPNCIQTDRYAIELSAKERSQIELENALKEQKQLFWTEKLQSYFDLKPLFSIFYAFDKLLRDKIGEEFDDAKTLLENMRKFAHNQEDTIKKFQNQLQNICAQIDDNACHCGLDPQSLDTNFTTMTSGVFQKLQIRCQKAVEYFYPLYINELLLPLRQNIENFYGIKKSRAYYKNILDIEQNLTIFIEDLKRVRYYNKPLINSELLTLPTKNIEDIPKAEKKQKGDSAKYSLMMYKDDHKSIEEIADERKLTFGTIFGHLAAYIPSGQISIYELVSQEKVDKILPLLDAETKSATPIKEQLGDDVSFDEIRAVMRHWTWLKKMQ